MLAMARLGGMRFDAVTTYQQAVRLRWHRRHLATSGADALALAARGLGVYHLTTSGAAVLAQAPLGRERPGRVSPGALWEQEVRPHWR